MRFVFAFFALTVIFSASAAEARAQSLDENADYRAFKSWAGDTQFPNPVPNSFKFCLQSYERLIASGVSPSTRVREDSDRGFLWTGTLQEIKEKWCEAGLKKITGDVTAKHAPYKAALKADKLRLVIDETHGHVYRYALAGGEYTGDAKLLAAAKVWFLDIGPPSNEIQYCINGGKRNSVRRYTFDAEHKLLGTTQKQYCGEPPASAYR